MIQRKDGAVIGGIGTIVDIEVIAATGVIAAGLTAAM